MTVANRYTGKNLYVAFAGQELSGDFTAWEVTRTSDTADVTAGSEDARSYLATLKDATFRLERFDTATGGSAVMAALVEGASGTVEFGPQGTATGKPKYSAVAIVTNVSSSYPFSDAVVVTADFQRSGDWITHYEELGSTY
jgi:hypothetical protein